MLNLLANLLVWLLYIILPHHSLTLDLIINNMKDIKTIKFIDNVGKIMKNGIPLSYDRAFSKKYCKKYNVTPENITRIIKKISWKNLEIK